MEGEKEILSQGLFSSGFQFSFQVFVLCFMMILCSLQLPAGIQLSVSILPSALIMEFLLFQWSALLLGGKLLISLMFTIYKNHSTCI